MSSVCSHCKHPNPEASKYCGECGAALSLSSRQEQLPNDEYRTLSVLFSDLSSWTQYLAEFSAEKVLAQLTEIKSAAIDIVERHHGMVNQFVGDEIMALFGLSGLVESAPLHCVRAAHELHAMVRRIGHGLFDLSTERPVQLHSGFATGRVLLSRDGNGRFGGVYQATGIVVNLASRIVDVAASDAIVCCADSYARTVDFYDAECMPNVKLKDFEPRTLWVSKTPKTNHEQFAVKIQSGLMPSMTVDATLLHQQSLLKTLSLASYRTAVLCYQRGMRYPMAYPEPMMRVMSKDSLDGFIRPFEVHLRSRSVKIYRDTKVERVMLKERGGEVCTSRPLAMGDGDMGKTVLPYDALVLAVPIKQLSILLDDALFAAVSRFRRAGLDAPPPLGDFRELQSAAMASLDIQFSHKIPGMPKEHITFVQSEFDLSCVYLSQLWKTGDAPYINAVATDGRALYGLSEDYRQHLLLEEGLAFLGQRPADVESVTYRSNDDAPLFLNETGSWYDRPEAYTAVPSIVVAGDLVRNSLGIASVEGAMLSAKQAVQCLARYLGLQTQPRILVPQDVSNDSIRLRKQALEPWKALALSTLWAQRGAAPAVSDLME